MIKTKLRKKRRRLALQKRLKRALYAIIATLVLVITYLYALIFALSVSASCANAEMWIDDGELHMVSATAYTDKETSSGRRPVEGLTAAGMSEWVGCTCVLYDNKKDFLGFFEFMDVGYGTETACGSSLLKTGRNKGTIETGRCIDLYFDSEEEAEEWGKRTVYIQIIRSSG